MWHAMSSLLPPECLKGWEDTRLGSRVKHNTPSFDWYEGVPIRTELRPPGHVFVVRLIRSVTKEGVYALLLLGGFSVTAFPPIVRGQKANESVGK